MLEAERLEEKPPEDRPLITTARDGNRRILASVDTAAFALGLRPGMKLAQAQALVPNLAVHDDDPQGDAALLVRLAGWCLRYAPLASADPPDGLWVDVTGSTHLHGGEAALLHDLVHRLTRQGIAARAAIADTPAVAHAMARFGREPVTVVPHETPARHTSLSETAPSLETALSNVAAGDIPALANLPIEALRLPPDICGNLRLMGFERIGALAASARAPLVRRFGTLLATRLDQASGKLFEPIIPVTPHTAIQARLTFVEPLLTAEAFASVIVRLTTSVCRDLERAGRGARHLDLVFERVDGSFQAIRVASAKPGRDVRHLTRMLNERLEQVDPGLGIEAMRLVVIADDKVAFTQTVARLTGIEANPPDIAPLVDRLVNRLGEARVFRIQPVQSDVPERSVRRVPPLTPVGERCWPSDLPRPVRLLDPPQPVDAMALLPDHPPIAFTWRRIRHRVRRADGPERIAGEWWKRDGEMHSVRDYFRVEDEDGRRFWLFRRGDGRDTDTGDMRWFLHGFF